MPMQVERRLVIPLAAMRAHRLPVTYSTARTYLNNADNASCSTRQRRGPSLEQPGAVAIIPREL